MCDNLYPEISRRDFFVAHAPDMPETFYSKTGEPYVELVARWRHTYAEAQLKITRSAVEDEIAVHIGKKRK